MLNYKNHGRLWRVYVRSLIRYGTVPKFWNALRTELAYRRRQVDVRSAPYFINVEPLYYCNLACPLCDRQGFAGARRSKSQAGRLPLELFDRILDEVGDYLWQCHIFGLGEPFIDWPLTRQIIEKAHRRRIFTLVSTNCTLMTPEVAAEVVTCGLDHLVCAIDGITQESYGQYRVGGNVETALNNLRLLARTRAEHKSSIEIEWQFLVNKFNVGEIEAAQRLADEIGVFIRFSPMRGMEWNAASQQQWLPDPALAEWQEGRLKPGEAASSYHCYHLWRTLVLNSNGQLTRCPIYQNVAEYGKVADANSVMALYNGSSSQRARQLFSKGKVEGEEFPMPCHTCSFFQREHGGPNLDKGWTNPVQNRAPGAGTYITLEPRVKAAPTNNEAAIHDGQR
jgi:MoaA/NifB/PqqE/SkfB family radical SAM enzyme